MRVIPDQRANPRLRLIQGIALGVVVVLAVVFALPLGEDATFAASRLGTLVAGGLMVGALAWAVRR